MAVNNIRAKIFSSKDITEELVDCPEWGVKILVKSLTGKERDMFEKIIFKPNEDNKDKEGENFRAALVCMCCYDPESGEKLFTEADVEIVGNKNASIIDRLFTVGKRLSGMLSGEDAKKDVKN